MFLVKSNSSKRIWKVLSDSSFFFFPEHVESLSAISFQSWISVFKRIIYFSSISFIVFHNLTFISYQNDCFFNFCILPIFRILLIWFSVLLCLIYKVLLEGVQNSPGHLQIFNSNFFPLILAICFMIKMLEEHNWLYLF